MPDRSREHLASPIPQIALACNHHLDLDEVFVYEKAKHRPDRNRLISLYAQFRVERKVRKMHFDMAIGMRSAFSWSEAWLVYFTGAPLRVGYEPTNRGDRKFAFFYNRKVPLRSPEQHEVEKTLGLVKAIGLLPGDKNLRVAIPEEDRLSQPTGQSGYRPPGYFEERGDAGPDSFPGETGGLRL